MRNLPGGRDKLSALGIDVITTFAVCSIIGTAHN